MNGGYSPFDLDAFTNGFHQQTATGGTSQQQHSYQVQGMQVAQACFEGYDPTTQQTHQAPAAATTAPVLLTGFDPLPFNSTTHHTVLQPARTADVFLEPDPISTSVEQRHRGWGTPTIDRGDAFASSFRDPTIDDLIVSPIGAIPTPAASALAPQKARKISNPDAWLDSISIEVSGVSLEPMSGSQILERVKSRTVDVERRYLPCVDFLVSCQQELRAGLVAASQRRLVRHSYRDSLTPRQFFQRYLSPLANRFYHKNHRILESSHMTQALEELQKLSADAKKVEYQGCESIKNAYLGGMKDGESWGLRKWLSKNGGALQICNDLECILLACQKMDRRSDNTGKLAERLRPMAKKALDRLKREVPSSYQEQSSAHPYLPFFHRLECALRGISNFDPEDDDVICIDDEDEIQEVKSKAAMPKMATSSDFGSKRSSTDLDQRATKRLKTLNDIGEAREALKPSGGPLHGASAGATTGNDSDDDSDIEVVGVVAPGRSGGPVAASPGLAKKMSKQPLRCTRCTMLNSASSSRCCMCDQAFDSTENYTVEEDNYDEDDNFSDFADIPGMEETTATIAAQLWDAAAETDTDKDASSSSITAQPSSTARLPTMTATTSDIANSVEQLAYAFETNQQNTVRPAFFRGSCFWDSRVQYASALRLFVSILQSNESRTFVEPVNELELLALGKPLYSDIVRHPLCFQEIVTALEGDGKLPTEGLARWNMWKGKDLLQAIDLVFLNSLAYHGKERTKLRSQTNSLRKSLWDGINRIISSVLGDDTEQRRKHTPTRRGENSGFVVIK